MISSVRRDWERIYEDERVARRGCTAKYAQLSRSLSEAWREGQRILESTCRGASTIVDCGCGSFGMIIVPAAKLGVHVTGIDISSRALLLHRNRLKAMKLAEKVDLVLASVTALPFRAEVFAAATCSSVILHVDASKALPEIARVVQRKGRIWIDSWLNKYHPDNLQVIFAMAVLRMLGRRTSVPLRYYTSQEVQMLLHVNNLKVIATHTSQRLPLPFSYRALIPERLKLLSTNRFLQRLNHPQLVHSLSYVTVRE